MSDSSSGNGGGSSGGGGGGCNCPSPAPRNQFFGKYRGTVVDNIDPEGMGRILPFVPAFSGSKLNWALPCVPYAGPEVGFFAIPPISANVWIEFEGGDPNYPIWTGCFWEKLEIPLALELSPEDPSLIKVFRSDFCTLYFNDTPEVGGIVMEVMDPAVALPVTMAFNSAGVEINCGTASVVISPESGIAAEMAESLVTINEAAIAAASTEVSVTANTSVEGAVEVTGNTDITGTVQINGATTVEGAMAITGETNIGAALTVEGDANVAGAATMEGETNVLGALTVEGETNITPELTVEGDANVLGAVTVEGDEAVAGLIEGVIVPPF